MLCLSSHSCGTVLEAYSVVCLTSKLSNTITCTPNTFQVVGFKPNKFSSRTFALKFVPPPGHVPSVVLILSLFEALIPSSTSTPMSQIRLKRSVTCPGLTCLIWLHIRTARRAVVRVVHADRPGSMRSQGLLYNGEPYATFEACQAALEAATSFEAGLKNPCGTKVCCKMCYPLISHPSSPENWEGMPPTQLPNMGNSKQKRMNETSTTRVSR